MLLRVKRLDIHTGGPFISILHARDAEQLDVHYGDRILISHNNHKEIAVVDITHHKTTVRPGSIGLMEELQAKLNARHGVKVRISIIPHAESTIIIGKKMAGRRLSSQEFFTVVKEIVRNRLTEAELAAFVTACFIYELSNDEVVSLCKAMVLTGERITFRRKPVMDVHCIGGIPGNRTTPIIVPIIAAAGLLIPKTSSRAITSPSGTADTLETIMDVSLGINRLKKVIEKTNGAMVWGGALNLAPADDRIIRIEHPLNIDAEGQMIASVMAKKYAVGSTHLLLDIPVGGMAKVKSPSAAMRLKRRFEYVGRRLGIKMRIIFTEGEEPIGNGIGPALEAQDILKILKNDKTAPVYLKEKSLKMAGIMLEMAGRAKTGFGYKMAGEILSSGRALKKFNQMVEAQGRAPKSRLKLGKYKTTIFSKRNGKVSWINARILSQMAKAAGAPKDYGAGVYLHQHLKDMVQKGQPLFTVYAENSEKLKHSIANEQLDLIFRVT